MYFFITFNDWFWNKMNEFINIGVCLGFRSGLRSGFRLGFRSGFHFLILETSFNFFACIAQRSQDEENNHE